MSHAHTVPFGPVSFDNPWIDNFSYEDVKESHCVAQVATNISQRLIEVAQLEGKKFLAVCCPAYNEESEEMLKTITSMMTNFHYLKHKTPNMREFSAPDVQEEFQNVIPVIVPIFDGTKALSATMKQWISENFPGALDELEGRPSEPGAVEVRVYCNKFWFYTGDPKNLSKETSQRIQTTSRILEKKDNDRLSVVLSRIMDGLSDQGDDSSRFEEKDDLEQQKHHHRQSDATLNSTLVMKELLANSTNWEQEIMNFYCCPIIKKSNHRKHNSHQWFFDSICEGLEEKVVYTFLTDCGTSFQPQCLSFMLKDLYQMHDIIGVTARQRVDTPNRFFKPCQDSPFPFLVGDHSENPEACWKCWATFILSPAPLQGFEWAPFAMFNMIEVLPVMPGPCQVMHWQKMKQFQVVDEYFNLLFEGENEKKLPELPHGLRKMSMSTKDLLADAYDVPRVRHSRDLTAANEPVASAVTITFTEFLRVNMRLAEDRILSFVSVFSTGYGTKWTAGSIFYYQPEIQWTTLLTQRRRWMNGSFCGFLFYFMSERARSRVRGGTLDVHKPGRSAALIDAFMALQVVQLLMVMICPAILGLAGFLGANEIAILFPTHFSWTQFHVYGPIRLTEIWVGLYVVIVSVWVYMSFTAPRGKMPEWLCQLLCIYGFVLMVPVYVSIWWTMILNGPGVIGSMVILNICLPFVLSLAESFELAGLYALYLPWFMVGCVFFLVFMPQYSFARLWDTTWGNRATGKDAAINDRVEDYMKRQNVFFSIALLLMNWALIWAFSRIFAAGIMAIIVFLIILFAPIFIQLLLCAIYMFFLLPYRKLLQFTKQSGTPEKKFDDLGIDFDAEGVNDVKSGTFFLDTIFSREQSETLPTNNDYKSFWSSPGSAKASQLELWPLIEEDKGKGNNNPEASVLASVTEDSGPSPGSRSLSMRTSSFHHQSFRSETSKSFDEESFMRQRHASLQHDSRRSSNRIEVAGRYAKV